MTDTEIADLMDVLAGTGRHADHSREQIGRCVHCSCGTRIQGRMAPGESAGATPYRFEVILADGFVSYRRTDRKTAEAVAGRPTGASVRDTQEGSS